tara:strand:- start:1486 stop:1719 length:234 start_codon:yes stop_codon:yes gene_type:complete
MFEWDHLTKAGASWFRHFYMAMYYSGIAFLVGIFGVIHAIFPPAFGFLPYRLAKKITDGAEKNFPACIIDLEEKSKK